MKENSCVKSGKSQEFQIESMRSGLITYGDNQYNIVDFIDGMNNRSCSKMISTNSDMINDRFVSNSLPLPTAIAYQDAGVQHPYFVLSRMQADMSDESIPVNQREDACFQILLYLNTHLNAAEARMPVLYQMGQSGDCCNTVFGVGISGCYGNQGIPEVEGNCCWSNDTAQTSISSGVALVTAIAGWRNSFNEIKNGLTAYQDDQISDAELQAVVNSQIAQANQMIAKSKTIQENAKTAEFLGSILRWVLPIIGLAALFYGWNVLKPKK